MLLGGLSSVVLAISSCQPLDIPLFRSEVDAGIALPSAPQSPVLVEVAPPDPAPEAPAPVADAGPVASREPCLPGALACEACVRAANCAQGQICHPRTGQCVASCSSSVLVCPASSVCDSSLGVCVDCVSAAQCTRTASPVCDTERGVCVECVTSSDCTSDAVRYPVCLRGVYRCGCAVDADCPGGTCEASEGHCED